MEDSIAALLPFHANLFDARMRMWKHMARAGRNEDTFDASDLRACEQRIAQAREALSCVVARVDADAAKRAQALHDKRLMEAHGLLFDDAMIADIDTLVGNVMRARPTLIVGDKGLAKTQLAKFVMSLYSAHPIVVSVKGDMMSDELIGQVRHDRAQQTFRFYEGPVPSAMRAGVPLLLDEINFGDQAVVARLQDMLLKRPGQTALLQEADEEVPVRPGFTVIATANEASARYRHREILDPAIRDRFEIIERSYPELDRNPLFDAPSSLMRLAMASQISNDGKASEHIHQETLHALVRLAAITQHLYAVPAKEASIKFEEGRVASVVRESAEPLMTDCITPRALCRTVEDCAAGNLPGRRLNLQFVAKMVRSLDQAGSRLNFDLASQAAELAGINLPAR